GDEARLALLDGDFAAAEARALDLAKLVAPAKTELEHLEPVLLLIDVYAELGDGRRAGAVAEELRLRRDAWIATPAIGGAARSGASSPRASAAASSPRKRTPTRAARGSRARARRCRRCGRASSGCRRTPRRRRPRTTRARQSPRSTRTRRCHRRGSSRSP